eukprot:6213909-Pleurochrysis_carterae.AAC.2
MRLSCFLSSSCSIMFIEDQISLTPRSPHPVPSLPHLFLLNRHSQTSYLYKSSPPPTLQPHSRKVVSLPLSTFRSQTLSLRPASTSTPTPLLHPAAPRSAPTLALLVSI